MARNGLMVSENEKCRKCCSHCKKNELDRKLNKTNPHTYGVSKLQCTGIGTPGLSGMGRRQMLSKK